MTKNLAPNNCIRLYDSEGKHVLTLLPCHCDSNAMDIATPEGVVMYCDDTDTNIFQYLIGVAKQTPIEEIRRQL